MKLWRLWAKALGEKASKCNRESDKIALVRTFIFASYLITNGFIAANTVRHWNDVPDHKDVSYNTICIQTHSTKFHQMICV